MMKIIALFVFGIWLGLFIHGLNQDWLKQAMAQTSGCMNGCRFPPNTGGK